MGLVGSRILIVEDEEDIRESLKEFFESEGCIVSTAMNGEQAFDAIEEHGIPDLILLDLMMPIMNGEEFVRRKRAENRFTHIPVVLMSADHHTPQKANRLQIRWYMQKPLELKSLVSMMEGALNAQRY